MVKINFINDIIEFEILGMHQLWTFKSSIKVKFTNINKIYKKEAKYDWFPGWRIPGTSIPYLITAGTYFKNNQKHFWDVTNYKEVYIIELQDSEYEKLFLNIININEIEELIQRVNSSI